MTPRSIVLLSLTAVGCAPAALQMPTVTTPTVSGGAGQRQVTVLTDLDTVRDVARGAEHVYVASDRGLLLYPAEGPGDVVRLGVADGMPSDDVRAVVVNATGEAFAATVGGVVQLRGREIFATFDAPPVGEVMGLHAGDGALYACGAEGLARRTSDAWETVDASFQCTGIYPTPEGHMWIATTRGARYVEGDVMREHADGRGIPAGYVRSIVPLQGGQAFALVQNTLESFIAWFDGSRWYGYTVADFEPQAVGLARLGGSTVLVTPTYLFRIDDAATGTGTGLRPLSRGERQQVLGYRLSVDAPVSTETAQVQAQAELERNASRLAAIPPNQESVEAPGFVIQPLASAATAAYLVRGGGERIFVADRNRGVAELGSDGTVARTLRSKDLVAARDLQVAPDERGNPWLLTDAGQLAVLRSTGELERISAPDGVRPWSIASGDSGMYMAATVTDQPNVVRVYRAADGSWNLVVERTLTFPEGQGPLVSTPLLGIGANEECWVAIRVTAATESGSRMRGVAVLSPSSETVVYHHSTSTPETDGEGSMAMPDDVSNIDMNENGMAWFSSILGAVRIGNHQSVTFGEDRGVRGEVVSDVLVDSTGRIWMAAAEGPGYREGQAMEFRMPPNVKAARPLALALSPDGHVWGAGNNGLVHFDGRRWEVFGESSGLPTTELSDIETDPANRLWILARDQLLVLGRPTTAGAAEGN